MLKTSKISAILSSLIMPMCISAATFSSSPTVSSSSHDTTNYSKNSSIVLGWNTPTVTGSLLGGYYAKLDTNSSYLVSNTDQILASTSSSVTETASSGDGSYYFHIAPYAADGTIGATVHFGPVHIDTTAPTGTTITPDGGSYTSTQTVSMSSGDSGASIYYTTDDSTPTTSSTKYTAPITVSSTKNIKMIAVDSAGNSSPVKTSAFTINNTANVAQLSGATAASTIATSTSAGATTATTSITVSGTDVQKYKYKFDAASYSAETAASSTISLTSLTDGTHTLYVLGQDSSGNWQSESSPTTLTFTVDNTAPSAPSFSESNTSTITYPVTVTISATGSSSIYYETSTSGTPTTPSKASSHSSQISLSSSGTYYYSAIAYDTVGNQSSVSTIKYTLDIPSNYPVISVSPTSGSFSSTVGSSSSAQVFTVTNSGSAELNTTQIGLNGTDASQFSKTTTCGTTLAANGGTCTVSVTYSPSAAGSHTARVDINGSSAANKTITLSGAATAAGASVSTSSSGGAATVVDTTAPQTTTAGTTVSGSGGASLQSELASTVTTATDGSKTITVAAIAAADGSTVTPLGKINADGSLLNTVSVTDASGAKIETKVNIGIVGASTKVAKDGSMETTAATKTQNGEMATIVATQKKDGTIDNSFSFTDKTTGQKVDTTVTTAVTGTNIKVDKNGEVTTSSPSFKISNGDTAQLETKITPQGGVSVKINMTYTDGTTGSITVPAFVGAKTQITKTGVIVTTPLASKQPLDLRELNAVAIVFGFKERAAKTVTLTPIDSKPTLVISKILSESIISVKAESARTLLTIDGASKSLSTGQTIKLNVKDGTFVSKSKELQLLSGWNLIGPSVNKIIENPKDSYGADKSAWVYRNGVYEKNPTMVLPGESVWIHKSGTTGSSIETADETEIMPKELMATFVGQGLMSLPKDVTVAEILSIYGDSAVYIFDGSSQSWKTYTAADGSTIIPAGVGFSVKLSKPIAYMTAKSGWNMLASQDGSKLGSATFSSLSSEWYTYKNGAWITNPAGIEPAEGFWLKASQDGEIAVDKNSSSVPSYAKGIGWRLLGTPIGIASSKLIADTNSTKLFIFREGNYKKYDTATSGFIPAGSGFWVK